jgi:hypothetical protein
MEEGITYVKCYEEIIMQGVNKKFWEADSRAEYSSKLLLTLAGTVVLGFGLP